MSDVLIVDDEPGVRESVRQGLRQAGLACRAVGSGHAALNAAREAWPAVVLLDLTLPGAWDGWQVWDRLIALSAGRALRVVVFAGGLDASDRTNAAQRGARAFLRKPATRTQLVRVLKQALDQGKEGAPNGSAASIDRRG